jgi:hypothetical protein
MVGLAMLHLVFPYTACMQWSQRWDYIRVTATSAPRRPASCCREGVARAEEEAAPGGAVGGETSWGDPADSGGGEQGRQAGRLVGDAWSVVGGLLGCTQPSSWDVSCVTRTDNCED